MFSDSSLSIFVAYHQADNEAKEKLLIALKSLERLGLVDDILHDGRIEIELESDIQKLLDQSEIVILLISPDALACDTFYEQSLQHSLKQAQNGECVLIPVLLSPVIYEYSPLKDIPHLPSNGQAIISWEIEEMAYHDVVKGIVAQIEEMKGKTSQSNEENEGMVLVEEGKFWMGRESGWDYEQPRKQVYLQDFYLDVYLVSVADYCTFLNENGLEEGWIEEKYSSIVRLDGQFQPQEGAAELPMHGVYWSGAHAYAKWKGKRLPTEAEWEYAAKGGQLSKGYFYAGSDEVTEVAWIHANAQAVIQPVGTRQANELGIYDLSGNVEEWCNDFFAGDYYKYGISRNPKGPAKGKRKVLRGGSAQSEARYVEPSSRNHTLLNVTNPFIGFRCAKDA